MTVVTRRRVANGCVLEQLVLCKATKDGVLDRLIAPEIGMDIAY